MIEEEIKKISFQEGFEICKITKAVIPDEDKKNILDWIKSDLHGEMKWFEKNLDVKLNFMNLGFKVNSVIVLASIYNDKEYDSIFENHEFKFSRYAVGDDYHTVLKKKSKPIIDNLKKKFPENHFRFGVDSLPVAEKILARESGLGWQGKNTNIINPEFGSYFFISVILTDLVLENDEPIKDKCASCRACIDACPTNALFDEYKIDAKKCISYLTIEDKRKKFPEEINLDKWVYGCDICQNVCPWNYKIAKNKNVYTKENSFKVKQIFKEKNSVEFLNMNKIEFVEFQKNSATDRIDFDIFQRNKNHL